MTTPQAFATDPLGYVFSRVPTKVLSAEEEKTHTRALWQRRRRLQLLVIWAEAGERFSGTPPMPREHQRPLTRAAVQRGVASESIAKSLLSAPNIRPEIRALLHQDVEEVAALREVLFNRNVRLIAWVAMSLRRRGMEVTDLFQEGSIALLRAIDRFDPAVGVRLATYATHAIRLSMLRALSDRGRPVRIPNHRFREIIAANTARVTLFDRLGREPDDAELVAESNLSSQVVADLLPALRPLVRLDAPRTETGRPLLDSLPDETESTPYERLRRSEARSRTTAALSRLPAREREILTLRYGLSGAEELTFDAIGRQVGLSRERTRQLEQSARETLRKVLMHAG